jgi:serine protease AprX
MVDSREVGLVDRIVFGIRWDGGKRPRPLVPAVVLAAVLAALVPAAAQARETDSGRREALRSVFVVPAKGQLASARHAVRRFGGRPRHHFAVAHGFAAQVPASALARLRRSAAVRVVAPDVRLSVRGASASAQDTANTASEVMRTASGAQALQDRGIVGRGIGVALVDSGVMTLPGLDDGQVVYGPDFSDEAGNPNLRGRDAFGHGTHLAGVIAGDDGNGFVGIAPRSRLVSVKVADADGSTSLLQVLAGLDWVRRHHDDGAYGIRVVNLSLGVDAENYGYVRDPLAYAAETLWHDGIVVVAAAGNNGAEKGQLDIPAADPYVLAVGALDTNGTLTSADDEVADFSSRSRRRPPDVIAPGSGIVSLRVPGSALDSEFEKARVGTRFFRGSGTSQATAVASGLVALLLQQRPGLEPDQDKALLARGARPVAGSVSATGAGRADATRSSALPAPSLDDVTQTWTPAILDPRALLRESRGEGIGAGASEWAGRRWSGRRWSGRRWSGRRWSGAAWVAEGLDGSGKGKGDD